LPGVKKVTNGFRRFREINTVTFDPHILTIDEMISALKAVDTYVGTADK
jgi:hypothetical protein